jgi:hypothetical protein
VVEARRCAFCGERGASREHVFPNWLVGVFTQPGQKGFNLTREHGRDKKNTRTLGLHSRAACVVCNTGWMSDLEEIAAPILTPAILGNTVSWGTVEQRIVARWAYKTALMTDRTNKPELWTTPDEHFKYLYERREPPPTAAIHLTRYVPSAGEVDFVAWVGSAWALVGQFDWMEFQAYRVTFNVGQLVFQVFGHLAPDDQVLIFQAGFRLPDGTLRTDLFRQLWPLVPGPHEWPPTGGHFDTASLHVLGRGPS